MILACNKFFKTTAFENPFTCTPVKPLSCCERVCIVAFHLFTLCIPLMLCGCGCIRLKAANHQTLPPKILSASRLPSPIADRPIYQAKQPLPARPIAEEPICQAKQPLPARPIAEEPIYQAKQPQPPLQVVAPIEQAKPVVRRHLNREEDGKNLKEMHQIAGFIGCSKCRPYIDKVKEMTLAGKESQAKSIAQDQGGFIIRNQGNGLLATDKIVRTLCCDIFSLDHAGRTYEERVAIWFTGTLYLFSHLTIRGREHQTREQLFDTKVILDRIEKEPAYATLFSQSAQIAKELENKEPFQKADKALHDQVEPSISVTYLLEGGGARRYESHLILKVLGYKAI